MPIALLLAALLLLAPARAAGESREYLLGAGDILKITVFQNPELSVEARVSESGSITYPLLGNVQVGGLTITAAERRIADLLRDGGFLVKPQVAMLVLQVRGNQVAVLGQVNRPGRYPLETTMNKVSDLLAQAGGVTPLGSDVVDLVGQRDGKPFRMAIDIPEMLSGGRVDNDVAVMPGDILYVDRAPTFYIYGEVQRPGAYRVERKMTVRQALAQGGGVTQRGTERGIRVHRRNGEGKVDSVVAALDLPVLQDDVIYVRESLY